MHDDILKIILPVTSGGCYKPVTSEYLLIKGNKHLAFLFCINYFRVIKK